MNLTYNYKGGLNMQCPYCNHKECKVIDSRHTDSKSIRRRRECDLCKKRFTTYEKIETTPIMVIKKDNTREYFDVSIWLIFHRL